MNVLPEYGKRPVVSLTCRSCCQFLVPEIVLEGLPESLLSPQDKILEKKKFPPPSGHTWLQDLKPAFRPKKIKPTLKKAPKNYPWGISYNFWNGPNTETNTHQQPKVGQLVQFTVKNRTTNQTSTLSEETFVVLSMA